MQGDRDKQLKYEVDSDTEAAARRLTELQKAALAGDTELPRTSALLARLHSSVAANLSAEANAISRGTGAKFRKWLRALPPEVAAVIAIRECIAACTSPGGANVIIQDLAIPIGRLYELEVRIREAEMVNPLYMQRIHDQVKENCTRSQSHLRRLYTTAYERVMKEAAHSSMTKSELLQVGKFGVQACLDAGLIEVFRGKGSKGTIVWYELSEEVSQFITNYTLNDVRKVVDKEAGAMMCPPDEWTTLYDGGYLSTRRKAVAPLMSTGTLRRSEVRRIADEFTAEKMPEVFAAGNYLQSVAFELHQPTLEAIRDVWAAGGGVLGVPKKNPPTKPEFPFPEEWVRADASEAEQEVFNAWKQSAVQYFTKLREWRGKVREIGGFLRIAHRAGPAPVWFPVYCDKRGRWYYRGAPNPQGSDLARSVLHLHTKKPLGVEGVFWLKVHIANAFGFDKERFVDRARWTEQHWERIAAALDSPADNAEVFGDDAPWGMYSAAWELREAYRSGNPATYQTGIPIHMDATCSGLQHFAALLRDPVGGMYVNLTDAMQGGPKQDIYSRVATNALKAIERDLFSDDPEVRVLAEFWHRVGISRTMAKKPVMTYVYGATLSGTAGFISDHLNEKFPNVELPDGLKRTKATYYAALKLFQGIASTVPAAENAMHWLKEIVRKQPKGMRMEWKTPTGFLVQHDYQCTEDVAVWLRSCGLQKVLVRNVTDDTNTVRMVNAIAPNFVHALDASHLTYTANAMHSAGLEMVAIHDSFGTHPCDVPQMHRIIREQFVHLYDKRNILGEFLWDVSGIGEPPMRGNLKLEDVLESEFFFC